jgi:hypothetical protein
MRFLNSSGKLYSSYLQETRNELINEPIVLTVDNSKKSCCFLNPSKPNADFANNVL